MRETCRVALVSGACSVAVLAAVSLFAADVRALYLSYWVWLTFCQIARALNVAWKADHLRHEDMMERVKYRGMNPIRANGERTAAPQRSPVGGRPRGCLRENVGGRSGRRARVDRAQKVSIQRLTHSPR